MNNIYVLEVGIIKKTSFIKVCFGYIEQQNKTLVKRLKKSFSLGLDNDLVLLWCVVVVRCCTYIVVVVAPTLHHFCMLL